MQEEKVENRRVRAAHELYVASLEGKEARGALLMDVKSAFNVSRPILGRILGELGIEPDLVRWTDSFMSGRKVRLVLEGKEGEEHKVETGVPQESPVAYLSGV